MAQDKKSISEIDVKLKEIKSSFDREYKDFAKQLSGNQSGSFSKHGNLSGSFSQHGNLSGSFSQHGNLSGSSSQHGNLSTGGDSSATHNGSSNKSKKGRPKANRVETSSERPDHEIYGFENEKLFLINFLLKQKESEEFKTLAIVGKFGIGKTTLCQYVFNEEEVKGAYFPRIWVSMYSKEKKEDEVPKIDVVKRILRSLGVEDEKLEHIKTEAVEEKRKNDEEGKTDEETDVQKELSELLNVLNLNLFGKRYLIVLDDVWEDNEWDQRLDDEKNQQKKSHLSYGFPKGFGGRVIMTSRDKELAKKMVGEEENMQHLFPRPDAESVWKIYKDAANAALQIDVNPRYPGRFKQELMDKSCGIPWAARMLATKEPEKVDETGDMERNKSLEPVKVDETGDMERNKSLEPVKVDETGDMERNKSLEPVKVDETGDMERNKSLEPVKVDETGDMDRNKSF